MRGFKIIKWLYFGLIGWKKPFLKVSLSPLMVFVQNAGFEFIDGIQGFHWVFRGLRYSLGFGGMLEGG